MLQRVWNSGTTSAVKNGMCSHGLRARSVGIAGGATLWIRLTLLTVCLTASLALPASGGISEKLQRQLRALEAFGFSGAVLVAVEGEVLVHDGYGLAQRLPEIAMQPESIFPVASISKQFTAAAILMLESEGKLGVSDTLSQHLPDVPPELSKITLHQLLTHTSGLPFECPGQPATRQDFLHCIASDSRPREPGRWSYSNAGYALLAAVVQEASKLSYKDYLRRHLLDPLEMGHTGFLDEPTHWSPQQMAHQYTWEVGHGTQMDGEFNWNLRGSADVVTTAGDLFRWGQALLSDKVLPAASRQKLFQAYQVDPESGLNSGYGWQIDERAGAYLSGGTFTLGFNSAFRLYPEKKAIAIVLSNQNYGLLMSTARVIQSVESILLGRGGFNFPEVRPSSNSLLRACQGTYVVPGGGRLKVELHDGGLLVSPQGQPAVNLLTARQPDEARLLQAATQRTEQLMQALQQRRFSDVGEVLGELERTEEIQSTYRNWIESLESRLGSLQSVQVIGTIPQGASSRTYVELEFENGREVRRLRWVGQRLSSILTGALPLAPTRFLPVGEKRLVGFHLAFGRLINLRIRLNRHGKVNQLRFDTPTGKVTAQRQP